MFSSSAPPTARIAAALNTMQPAERRVAELIVESADAVVEWTAQELADRAGVGRATVVRSSGSGSRTSRARSLAHAPSKPA